MASQTIASEVRKNLPKVCIIGGGNAAHVLAAWLPSRGFETYWFTSFGDEADRINASLAKNGDICVDFDTISQAARRQSGDHVHDHVSGVPHRPPHGLVKGRPVLVSNKAGDVVPLCDLLLAPVPSFAYQSTLQDLRPYLRKGHFLGVTPGQGGFDWMANEVLGEQLYSDIHIFSVIPMLLNCRIVEFGHHVHVTSVKQNFKVACNLAKSGKDDTTPLQICELVRVLFDAVNVDHVGGFITGTLYPINSVLHPARNFSVVGESFVKGKDYLDENPLFYEDMDDTSVSRISAVSQELKTVADMLARKGAQSSGQEFDLNIPTILEFLQFVYGTGYHDLKEMFTKNPAYKGYRCPLTQSPSGWEPNFGDRYYLEDIPLGLCVIKGVADLVDVETPTVDRLICWAQGQMNKEYIKDGKLQGKDVKETTAPQRFGIDSLDKLLKYYS
eukprot:GHVQ01005210.1.p1 GENE.GHVQ01005210.1~~GHVQ01005210.1.p1  ORF type:complete len:443 (+),score=29.76 GHVQ01005210.1:202-1530(+)